jgi:hypothetical protein
LAVQGYVTDLDSDILRQAAEMARAMRSPQKAQE